MPLLVEKGGVHITLRHLQDKLLNTLYAPCCSACDLPVGQGQALCSTCVLSCEAIGAACPSCALPIAGPRDLVCARCRLRRPSLDSCSAVYEYGGQIAVALKRLKFQGRSDIARTLSPLLLPRFTQLASRCDLALPLPLHRKRLADRGFNQSLRLLLPLAAASEISVLRTGLKRCRDTKSQARLNAKQRVANLRGAFEATASVAGKRVLLLDDVRTTGSTLNAATRALRRSGATEVHAFVVAQAEWAPDVSGK